MPSTAVRVRPPPQRAVPPWGHTSSIRRFAPPRSMPHPSGTSADGFGAVAAVITPSSDAAISLLRPAVPVMEGGHVGRVADCCHELAQRDVGIAGDHGGVEVPWVV